MTKPKAHQIEASTGLSPLAREWIRALVSEAAIAVEASIEDASASRARSSSVQPGRDPRVDDLLSRIEYLERRAESDDRYSLTKGKIIALMKKHGIE